jgi:hypothetical protein
MSRVTTLLPYVEEPEEIRRALNAPAAVARHARIPSAREAALRHGGDLVDVLYPVWKPRLKGDRVGRNDLQSAASRNRDSWRSWADGDLTWRNALEDLLEQLNGRTGAAFALSE